MSIERLRVVVVVSDATVCRWIVRILEAVAGSPLLALHGIVVARPVRESAEPRGLLAQSPGLRNLAWIDRRVFARRAVLLEPVSLSEWAADMHGTAPQRLLSDDAGRPARLALSTADVVVDLSDQRSVDGERLGTRQQLWWLAEGGPSVGPRRPRPGIAYAVVRGQRTLPVTLMSVDAGDSTPVRLAAATCPTHPCSPLMTAAYLALTAHELVVSELERRQRAIATAQTPDGTDMRILGSRGDAGKQGAPRTPVSVPARWLTPAEVFGHMTGSAAWVAHRLGFVQQWHVRVGPDEPTVLAVDPRRLTPLLPPRGHYWADPQPFVEDGTTHILFEDYVYAEGKGRIASLTLDAAGRLSAVRPVLTAATHLSYPYIFRHDGRLFMVPENAAAARVDLYECVGVPDKWVRRRSLLTGVRLVDATLLEWDGRWWMFASEEHPLGLTAADTLVIYVTDDPVVGEWTPHPAGPIKSDVTARCAGPPFVHDGRLLRPSQDATGGYGSAVAINEVVALTPTRYEERRVGSVRPDLMRGAFGLHTLSRRDGVVAIDVCRWMPRSAAGPIRTSG